ncbi:MAG TPA: MobC family plasmid mobilization relaxosome protein [Methyloceanibacter sp.]|nr:MobC family plasmid mobilization relaxosome protein [Methyloceanibacter sp.]
MTGFGYGKREAPFSLRLSFEEKVKLQRAAGGLPLSSYIKSLLFADEPAAYRPRQRAPIKDHKALAEVLACLGASRIANNLNQLAKAANSGSLYVEFETKARLNAACDDVRVMRQLLMVALGMPVDGEAAGKQSTSQSFARAVGPPRPQP